MPIAQGQTFLVGHRNGPGAIRSVYAESTFAEVGISRVLCQQLLSGTATSTMC